MRKIFKEHKAITLIALVIMIVFIVIFIAVFLLVFNNSQKKTDKTISNIESYNTENTAKLNINYISSKTPDGTPYKMSIKETVDDDLDSPDYIYINNFVLAIPIPLKKAGYKISLSNNDTVLNITSKDNTYVYNLSVYSDIPPDELTNNQAEELYNIFDTCSKYATKQCDNLGISENDNKYDEYYIRELYNIRSSAEEVNDIYDKYHINKYTRLVGFNFEELTNAWELLGINWNSIDYSHYIELDKLEGGLISYYNEDSITIRQLENDKGLFIIKEVYDDKTTQNNYQISFFGDYNGRIY